MSDKKIVVQGHPSEGGSYVKNEDGTCTLVHRGHHEPVINTAVVVVPEHEEAMKKEEAKAQSKAQRHAAHAQDSASKS